MKQITVERLMVLCGEQVAKGNGHKIVLLSNDDEGNGYHECFYEFTPDVESNVRDTDRYTNKTHIILG